MFSVYNLSVRLGGLTLKEKHIACRSTMQRGTASSLEVRESLFQFV